jgi:1-phosphofructokinase family hexose kinase
LLIATPNIAVDRTVRLPELRPGQVMRPSRAVVTAGGKGLNVGRAWHALKALAGADSDRLHRLGAYPVTLGGDRARPGGGTATLVSFRGTADAEFVDRLFAAEPVRFVGVDVPGEARVATIYLEQSGRVTVLNEPGPELTAGDWARYEAAVAAELTGGRHRTLVCSGSLPPGAPDDAYARLVQIGRRAGVRVVVDAARAALAAALAAGPDAVTPNLAEADGVMNGHSHEAVDEAGLDVPHRAGAAAEALCARGARSAVVTAGAAGAAYCAASGGVIWVPTVKVEVVNPIGAGDSFVAGLVHGWEGGADGVDAVTFALATATASVEQELAGGVDPRRVREIVGQLGGMVVAKS